MWALPLDHHPDPPARLCDCARAAPFIQVYRLALTSGHHRNMEPSRVVCLTCSTANDPAKMTLVQPLDRGLRDRLNVRHGNWACLMVDHPPSAMDPPKPICGGKRMGVADQFDANYPTLIAQNHRHGVVWLNALLVRIAKDIAVRLKDCRTPNESWPAWMHTGDIPVGPERTTRLKSLWCVRRGWGLDRGVWLAPRG